MPYSLPPLSDFTGTISRVLVVPDCIELLSFIDDIFRQLINSNNWEGDETEIQEWIDAITASWHDWLDSNEHA